LLSIARSKSNEWSSTMQIAMTNGAGSNAWAYAQCHVQRNARPAASTPLGDVIDLTCAGMDVEIVLGFRPGLDRLVLPAGPTLGFRQEGSDVVISRGSQAVIVLQGVSIAEMVAGGGG
jgi:hypothetical protein